MNLLHLQMWIDIVSAFTIFCMLSGSEYIINDIADIEKDKKHPKKCKRPIPSGRLKTQHAMVIAVGLFAGAIFWAYFINLYFLISAGSYFVLILLYSLYLKRIIFVDILIISTGFVIRAIAGCLAISVRISPWLIICAFLMALFLALLKRRNEKVVLGDAAEDHRKSLEGYSLDILDRFIVITTTALIMSYSLYTFLTGNQYMMITIPLIIYGLFRYLFLVYKKDLGGEPFEILLDRGIIICILLYGILLVLILYEIPQHAISLIPNT